MKGKVDFLFFESDISIAATGILFDAAFALLNFYNTTISFQRNVAIGKL
jgi:hypothetical protein